MSTAEATNVDSRVVSLRNGLITTRVLVGGQGDPLVYIHGAGGLMWDPFVDALASQYTVYAPEHPGSGESTGLEELRDLWDLVLYYNDLLDALELPSARIVGHSFGGMVAAELAANNPERATKLVLIAPIGLWRDDTPIPDIAATPAEKLPELVLADPTSPLAAFLTPPLDDPEALFQAAMRMASILHFIWPIPDKGLDRRVHRVSAPTLLVWGKQDRLVPCVYADEFASKIRDTQIALVDDAGHLPQLEQPVEVRERVLSFLA
jgi:pimeloyl-ACP methyl ester carboxylesterase